MIVPEVAANKSPGMESIVITVTNSDYNKSKEFTEILKTNAAIKNMEPNFENGTSTITLDYDGKTSKLLDKIMTGKLANTLKVTIQKIGIIIFAFK